MKTATDSSPAAPATLLLVSPDNPSIATSELFPELATPTENRPQSSPIAARLSRQDLRDLVRLCDCEVQHTGISQDAGKRALALKEKLLAIHKHGWTA